MRGKGSKITVIDISGNHNDERIVDVDFFDHLIHTMKLYSKFFLTHMARFRILNIIQFIKIIDLQK